MSTETADQIKTLESALKEKVAFNKTIADSFEITEDGTVNVTVDQKEAFDANTLAIKEIQTALNGLQAIKSGEEWLSAPASTPFYQGNNAPRQAKSIGEQFIESAEFKALNGGRNGVNMPSAFEIKQANISAYARKDLYAGDFPTAGDFPSGGVQRLGIVGPQRRDMRVRDLFPVQTTSAAVIEYFRASGFTNNAAPVAQRDGSAFAAKPQSTMSWTGHQAPVRTIAHWEAAHRNVLADEPQLRGLIDNNLLYGLRLVEDAQILAGSGTGEDLEGILNTPGIQSYQWSSGASTPVADTMADAVRRAATLAYLSYYQPTGVVLHPNDWEKIELAKDADGGYLVAVSVALGGEPRVWQMPVIASPAIQEGTGLVGAFGLGAQLYDREEANIRISESHSDFFVRNAVVVLAEQRLALAVTRPEAFVEIDFDSAPA